MIFLNLRTDLALERHEISPGGKNDGILFKKYTSEGIDVTEIEVLNEKGEKVLDKPEGKYFTFEVTPFSRCSELFSSNELRAVSSCIKSLLPQSEETVLIAGLGNDEITADSLGPKTASMIFSTRHIGESFSKSLGLGKIRSVASVSTGVLGKTGIETGEIIESIAQKIRPCAVITVDALAARRLERLGTTVQISTSGIVPGSGVGNSRQKIDEETVGCPVISMGVPMVVDARTFVSDILSGCDEKIKSEALSGIEEAITVTHKDIDLVTERASRLIAMSINCALQPSLSPEEIFEIVSQ